jgi:hypothetical protein
MRRMTSATGATIFVALFLTPVVADDSETLQDLRAQLREMERKLEALEERADEQDARQETIAQEVEKETSALQKAMRTVQVYGQARVSADFVGDDAGSDGTEFVSNASRIGIRGELGSSLPGTSIIYKTELRYETTDEVDGVDSKDVEFREGYGGLKGTWGVFRMGRLAVGYKKSGTKIEPWTDNAPQARAGGRQGMSELHSAYVNNSVDYESPVFGGGFTANAWYSTRFDDSEKRPFNSSATRLFQGGTAGGFGLKYASGPVFLAADWQEINADSVDLDGDGRGDIDADIGGRGVRNGDSWQAVARYTFSPSISFAALYEDAEEIGLGKHVYLNSIYTMGRTRLIAAYGRTEDRRANGNFDWVNWSIGAKHMVTGNSEIFAAWNRRRNDSLNLDTDTFTVGTNIKFGY